MVNIEQIRPRPGWALCRAVRPTNERPSGLVIARDVEDGKTTEGVCEVIAVTHARAKKNKDVLVPLQFGEGDFIIFRDHLKNANQVGHLVDEEKNSRVFLLHIQDALAVAQPSGDGSLVLGHYGEYRL